MIFSSTRNSPIRLSRRSLPINFAIFCCAFFHRGSADLSVSWPLSVSCTVRVRRSAPRHNLNKLLLFQRLEVAGEGGSVHHQFFCQLGDRDRFIGSDHHQHGELGAAQSGIVHHLFVDLRHHTGGLADVEAGAVGAGGEVFAGDLFNHNSVYAPIWGGCEGNGSF